MNDKYMTLFKKTNEQLEKELHRRGFNHCAIVDGLAGQSKNRCPGYMTPERAIAEIIYKDAFDAGRSLKAKEVTEEKRTDYLITDNHFKAYKVSLTDSQEKLLRWLIYNLGYDINYETFTTRYKDVGRI